MDGKVNNSYAGNNNRFGQIANMIKSTIWVQNIVAILIILVFALINVSSVWRNFAITTDEDKHYLYGERIMEGDSSRFNPSTMPVTALNAIPRRIASFLAQGHLQNVLNRHSVARVVTILFSCLVAYLVFHWARLLYGFIPALFSLVLYVLDPNIIAHSQLVTTDLYVTGFMVFAFYMLWKFAHERNLKNGLLCLTALGITQITKYTAVVLFPLFFVTLLMFDLLYPVWLLQIKENIRSGVFKYIKYAVFAALVSIIIINLGFLFNRSFKYFGEYDFRSGLLQQFQSNFPSLYYLRVPVPEPYLSGLDSMNNTEQTGSASGNVYLLGKVRKGSGFSGYYFIASMLKVPISTQVILMLAFWVYFTRKDRRSTFLGNEMFLLVSVLFFTIYFNFFFKTQVGIRYYLPVFPFLYIFSGNLFLGWDKFSRLKKTLPLMLIVYLSISVFSYHPHYLSYFNEIIWNRMDAYKYLADSNIDWGQDRNELQQYLSDHPGALYKPSNIRPGRLVIRVNDLVGVTQDPEKYAWLRENFEPIESIAYSYLVYRISPEEIDELCATTTYCDK